MGLRETSQSQFSRHAPCPSCGSSDAFSVYTDGHGYCFSCQHYQHGDGNSSPPHGGNRSRSRLKPVGGKPAHLKRRKITEPTCAKWGYHVGRLDKQTVQIANYRSADGKLRAQKVRFKNKEFTWTGNAQNPGLYGMHLWRDGGKMLVITEGELDALSVSQLQGNKWPVVSVPNGAQGARREIQRNIDWVELFETVIFMFDADSDGIAAASDCASVITPGKARIARLPLKDANEMLVAGRGKELIDAMWSAKEWRPDEIVSGTDLWETIIRKDPPGSVIRYPWAGLNEMLHGLRFSEIVTICGGTGTGKSAICRELAHHVIISEGGSIGYIALEESIKQSALGLLSVAMDVPLHLRKHDEIDRDELRKAFETTVGSGRFYSYDHFGSLEADNLFNRIRYMVQGCNCKWIVLDHISIVVSGMDQGDERRLIDNLMTRLRSLVEQLNFGLILVSHLREPDGKKPLEEGGQTHLNLLRGSRAIGQLSDIVIGFERDQQDDDTKYETTVRILKNRFSGQTGVAAMLLYNPDTGRLTEDGETFNDYFESSGDTGTNKPDF